MVEGTALQELKLAGIYRWPTDQLKIDRLTVKALDGEALATGELLNLTGQPSLWLETQIEGVDLAQLPPELLVGEKPWPALAGTRRFEATDRWTPFALSGEGS